MNSEVKLTMEDPTRADGAEAKWNAIVFTCQSRESANCFQKGYLLICISSHTVKKGYGHSMTGRGTRACTCFIQINHAIKILSGIHTGLDASRDCKENGCNVFS